MTRGPRSYPACRREASHLRERGDRGFAAPSAALVPGGAHGWRVAGGLHPGPGRDGRVIVLFGARPDVVGWEAVYEGRAAGYPEDQDLYLLEAVDVDPETGSFVVDDSGALVRRGLSILIRWG